MGADDPWFARTTQGPSGNHPEVTYRTVLDREYGFPRGATCPDPDLHFRVLTQTSVPGVPDEVAINAVYQCHLRAAPHGMWLAGR